MTMRRAVRIAVAFACALAVPIGLAGSSAAATYPTVPATGNFAWTTANGILPTWTADDIAIIGVSPGSVTTATSALTARVSVPIIAKTGSANAAGGGFRFNNVETNASVRCSNPTIDTRARVVDCVLADGSNANLFTITKIASAKKVVGTSTITTVFRGVELRIADQDMADYLNDELATMAFSTSVLIGKGDLIVTRDREP